MTPGVVGIPNHLTISAWELEDLKTLPVTSSSPACASGKGMTLRLSVFSSFTIVISFTLLIALPVWKLYGDFFRDFITTALTATPAFPEPYSPSTTTKEAFCNPNLFPPGHWTHHPREPNPQGTPTGPRALHGTVAVQHAIYRHQHPESCNSKRFLIYQTSGSGNGIGSVLHRTTILLQAALDLNRILVLHPQPQGQWVDAPYCSNAYTLDSCYFEPITNCSIGDAMQHNTWESFPWLDSESYERNEDRVLKYDYQQSSALFLIRRTPVMFHGLLRQGKLSVNDYYWWRAQGVAYIVRPNAKTLTEIERRRVRVFGNRTIEEGTVSVHVRRGDKGRESPLAADEAYLQRVEELVGDGVLKRSIFLSTEDANTVRFFAGLQKKNWTVQWTNVPRQEGFQGSTAEFARMVGWSEEFLNSLLNLELALECDAWVGMIASNWNRLVDELRSTIRCKDGRPYEDVFVGSNITDYDW